MDEAKKTFRDAARFAMRQNVIYLAEISELHKCIAELVEKLNEFDRAEFLATLKERLEAARTDALVKWPNEQNAGWLDHDEPDL